jgi:2-keto-4-pentenoate hydratase
MSIAIAAESLLIARRERRLLDGLSAVAALTSIAEAHHVQDFTVAAMGGRGGWKVGAANPTAEPGVSALPRSLMRESPARFEGEIAFRFARSLPTRETPYTRTEVLAAVATVHPAIEIVDSRYSEWRMRSPIEQAADLGNHGAFVLGAASRGVGASVNQLELAAEIRVNGERRVALVRGNTAGDVQRLLTWLANHCASRGTPIEAGEVVTSGSCTGLIEVNAGDRVEAALAGLGIAEVFIE